ncbi:AraC-type DNA-binding protein [Lachnospiraceae bacterium KH1T2]|nr:AraC-type DNA-binding protein [Lachnospiraceae bacterium KH1T2]
MIPSYSENQDLIQIEEIDVNHFTPHLHESIELIYMLSGSMVIGTGVDLFPVEKGDLAIIFPNLIHHSQVFSTDKNRAIHILAAPTYFETFNDLLLQKRPEVPVVPGDKLHDNILYSIKNLAELSDNENNSVLQHSFLQIILARALPMLKLREREDIRTHDIVYQTVSYIAVHFKENLTLTKMAKDLGISQFSLSRVFSGIFHQNFNRYLNEVRLQYISQKLVGTSKPITELYLDAGFQSQATFNRVFQARYHMSPKSYREVYSSNK